MSTTATLSAITNKVEKEMERIDFMANPYFVSLRDESMTLATFLATQSQFYYAVRNFTHPMLTLLTRIPDPNARLALLHNVVEEHGEFKPTEFHQTTFECFLKTLGGGDSLAPPAAQVTAFNAALSGICATESVNTAACTIGAIEYAFASVSALIGQAVVQRGWVEQENLVHYTLHAEIDKRHAAELFEIVENDPNHSPEEVDQGLQLGLYLFGRLYQDLMQITL